MGSFATLTALRAGGKQRRHPGTAGGKVYTRAASRDDRAVVSDLCDSSLAAGEMRAAKILAAFLGVPLLSRGSGYRVTQPFNCALDRIIQLGEQHGMAGSRKISSTSKMPGRGLPRNRRYPPIANGGSSAAGGDDDTGLIDTLSTGANERFHRSNWTHENMDFSSAISWPE